MKGGGAGGEGGKRERFRSQERATINQRLHKEIVNFHEIGTIRATPRDVTREAAECFAARAVGRSRETAAQTAVPSLTYGVAV